MMSKTGLIPGFAIAAALALSVGCAYCKVPVSPVPSPFRGSYIDIQAGWRIRLVAPVLKSGKFAAHLQTLEQQGNVIALKAPSDFFGYEVVYYSVKTRPGGGVVIRFRSAEIREAKKVVRQSRPLVPLFDLPHRMRFVKLIFLTEVSEHDHNQGILAAVSLQRLNALTRSVKVDPDKNCRAYAQGLCSWIPRGMAAEAERRDPARHGKWLPVL